MSIIHDALKRVERKVGDAQREAVDPELAAEPGANRRWPSMLIARGLVLLVLLAVGGYWYFLRGGESAKPVPPVSTNAQRDAAPTSPNGEITVRSLVADNPALYEEVATGGQESTPAARETVAELTEIAAPAPARRTAESVAEITDGPGQQPSSTGNPETDPDNTDEDPIGLLAARDGKAASGESVASITTASGETNGQALESAASSSDAEQSVAELTAPTARNPGAADNGAATGPENVGQLTEPPEELVPAKPISNIEPSPPPTAVTTTDGTEAVAPAAPKPPVPVSQAAPPKTGKPGDKTPGDKNQATLEKMAVLERDLAQAGAQEQANDLAGALASYQQSAKTHPQHPALLLGMARNTAKLGRYQESLSWVAKIPEAERGWEAWFWSGYANLQLNNPNVALEHFARAGAGREDYLYLLLQQASALQQLSRHQEAIEYLHRARLKAPNLPEIAFNTGISWWALGDQARARAAFDQFIKLAAGNETRYRAQLQSLRDRYQIR